MIESVQLDDRQLASFPVKKGHRSSGKTHLDRHHQLAIGWTNHLLGIIILLAILHLITPIPVIMKEFSLLVIQNVTSGRNS
jgi:hypothetical protein